MQDKKHYYDEQIKGFYYERHIQTFSKSKEELKNTALTTLLALNTKPALTDIAKRLDVKGYSKLGKDGLVSLIAENIIKDLPELINSLSYKELTILDKLSKNEFNKYTFNIEELAPVSGLCALGLLFKASINSQLFLIVPTEATENIAKLANDTTYMANLKESSKDLLYIDGLITHYGMVDCSDLYNLITKDSTSILKEDKLDFYIDYIFRNYEVFPEANTIIHSYMFSPDDINVEVKIRHTIPYTYDNTDLFIKLGEDFKSTWGEEVAQLEKILLSKNLTKDACDRLLTEIIFYIKNDLSTASLLELLTESGVVFSNDVEASEAVEVLSSLYNTTSMWVLKGLTPLEVAARRVTVVNTEKEPGRNEPCPCGSGKKYKKCCFNK